MGRTSTMPAVVFPALRVGIDAISDMSRNQHFAVVMWYPLAVRLNIP